MFLNPLMLVGLGAAALPVVVHLLSRARYCDVEWGAMMFLQGADARQRSSSKLTQYMLLLIRMATVALLAVALARPVLQGRMAQASPGGRVTAALLLDCSASMSYDENGRTRFQMAQAAARQVLRGLRPGDRVCLILMGVPQTDADLEPTGDLRAVEARIDDAKVSLGRAHLRDSLNRASDVLDRYEQTARDIYVICDRQALSWKEIDDRFAQDWQHRQHDPASAEGQATGRSTRMFVLPVGGSDADNVAVESIHVADPPVIFYRHPDGTPAPVDVEVSIRNYGAVQRVGVPLALQAGDFHAPERSINLLPNQSTTVTVPVTFDHAGSYVISAQVKTAGYGLDDRLEAAADVLDPIRVLVISGDERAGPFRGESDFLRVALSPHAALASGPVDPKAQRHDPFQVTVVPVERWADVDFDAYQVVVLANVERFTPGQARTIERYVYNGGRLLVAPGSLSRYENYNSMLYREGAGILPAELDAPTAADGSQQTVVLSWDTTHPVFKFLQGQYEAPAASVVRYFPARPRQVEASAIAWYLSGDPFLIEGRSERGRVLLMTTSLDADWTTLPLSNFYLPFVQSAVRYLAASGTDDGNLLPGQPIRMIFDDPSPQRVVTLTRPDGRSERLDLLRVAQQLEVRYSDTDLPGQYQIRVEQPGKPPTTRTYVVHPPREESDLTQLTEERWKGLAQKLGFVRVDPTIRPLRETISSGREGRELWAAALGAVFVLMIAEMMLARTWSVRPVIRESRNLEAGLLERT